MDLFKKSALLYLLKMLFCYRVNAIISFIRVYIVDILFLNCLFTKEADFGLALTEFIWFMLKDILYLLKLKRKIDRLYQNGSFFIEWLQVVEIGIEIGIALLLL